MIWKVTYKKPYGTNGLSYDNTKFYYDEKQMLREIKKLPTDVKGTIQVFENTKTFGISEHLDSLKRDVQLTSVLEISDEVSTLHSKFIKLYENGKDTNHPLSKTAMTEWEYLDKKDEKVVKKYFAKYRSLFLNYCLDTEEWYDTLLRIYSYANISDDATSDWVYSKEKLWYEKIKVIKKSVTDEQRKNYNLAKSKLKKII